MDDRAFMLSPPRRGCVLAALWCVLLSACSSPGDGTPSVPVLLGTTLMAAAGIEPRRADVHPEPARIGTLQFTDIAAGAEHSCAIDADGAAWCWGSNQYRQLGNAPSAETCSSARLPCSSVPVRIDATARFTALAASLWGTCALDAAGHAWCWGFGLGAARRDGLPASNGVPQRVDGEHEFVALASSPAGNETCALTYDGELWCWRVGSAQGLGVPARVGPGVAFLAVGIGTQHGCGIDTARDTLCWGSNQFGQLGLGASALDGGPRESALPVAVTGGYAFAQVAAGPGHSCGLRSGGELYCWGQGFVAGGAPPARQAPDRRTIPHGGVPVPVETAGAQWIALSAGTTQTCALATDGALYCFTTTPTLYSQVVGKEVVFQGANSR